MVMLLPLLIKPLAVPLTMNRIVLISSQASDRCTSSAYYKGISLLIVSSSCRLFGVLRHLFASFHRLFGSLDYLCMTSVHLSGSSPVVRLPCDCCYRVTLGELSTNLSRLLSCFLQQRERIDIFRRKRYILSSAHNGHRRRKFLCFYIQQMHF